jgi:hypothetical protein
MKRIFSMVAIIAVTALAIAQVKNMEEKQDNRVAEELRELSRRWLDAIAHRDRATLGDLLADDVIVTNSDGKVLSKAEVIDRNAALIHHVAHKERGKGRVECPKLGKGRLNDKRRGYESGYKRKERSEDRS